MANERFILKLMQEDKKKTLTISLRPPHGWSKPLENIDTEKCDIDGAQL